MKYNVFTSFDQGNTQALQICRDIAAINLNPLEELFFDFTTYGENNPFGNLLIINSLKRCRKRYPNNQMKCIPKDYDGYLSHIGFYKAIGIDVGKQPGEAVASTNYVPISRISFSPGDFYSSIEVKSQQLANTLCFGSGVQKMLSYMFVETIRNAFEHSDDKSVLVAAQKWPKFDLVEVAIADAGCGIQGSLGKLYASSDEGLLSLACMPGISAGSNYSYLEEDNPWRNSGYGLFILKELSLAYNGSFILCSGGKALTSFISNDTVHESFISTNYQGTAICLRFRTNVIIDFEKKCREIVERGQEQAKRIKGAIQVASKSSGGRYVLS